MSSGDERRQRLAERLAEAAARARETRDAARRSGPQPRPGDLWVLPGAGELPLLWAVIEESAEEPPRLLGIAADPNPLRGSADVAVPASAPCGALSLRCGCELWLARRDLDPELRVGALPPEVLAKARRTRAALDAGTAPPASARQRHTDREPEYQDWMEDVTAARTAVFRHLRRQEAAAFTAPPEASPQAPTGAEAGDARQAGGRRRAVSWPLAARLAAGVLLAVSLGWGGGSLWQQRQAGRPVVNAPFVVLTAGETERGIPETLRLGAGDRDVWLLFPLAAEELGYPRFRLEIAAEETGRGEEPAAPRWRLDGLVPNESSELSVQVPRRGLQPGEVTLRLSGQAGGGWELLRQHRLRVEVAGE